jgi:hypothetical protein
MASAQFDVEPAVHQLLQARLAAKMFRHGVMRQHVFPGINLQHLAFRRFGMRAKGLAPGEPPVIYRAFLLAADIAIKSLGPGQWRHPILWWDFLHEGRLHQRRGAISHFLSAKTARIPIFHRSKGVSLSFAQPSTGVPQTFCNSFIFQQQS